MTHITASPASLRPIARVASTAAAAVCAAGLNLGLLDLYDQAAPACGSNTTPELLQARAACHAQPGRQACPHCAPDSVARAPAPGARTAQLATH